MAEGCGRSLQREGTESGDRVLIKTLVGVLSIKEMYIELLPAQKIVHKKMPRTSQNAFIELP